MRVRGALLAPGLALSVASCGLMGVNSEDPTTAYATAEERALLELPPDLSGSVRQPLLRLPESGKSRVAHSTLLPEPESVRLVRDGGVRWLELETDARELWPELKNFLQRSGFILARDEPLLGLIETEWRNAPGVDGGGGLFSSGSDTDTRERFRLRIERVPGRDDAIRLFVTQRRVEQLMVPTPGGRSGERVLVKRPPDAERETELMLRLLAYLGMREQLARGVLTPDEAERLAARAYLEEVNGEKTLVVADTHHRVWALVGELLEDAGLDVERVVKSESRYEVVYSGVPPTVSAQAAADEADEGFFGGLFGDDDEIEQFYQIYVLEEPGKTRISIADIVDETSVPELKEEILQRLYEQLR